MMKSIFDKFLFKFMLFFMAPFAPNQRERRDEELPSPDQGEGGKQREEERRKVTQRSKKEIYVPS